MRQRRPGDRETLTSGPATVVLRPDLGGRISSLVIDGLELLVTHADRPVDWGLYPMAPFAGRVRDGEIVFGGARYQLPLTLPPHAIHGTLVTRQWVAVAPGVMEVDLEPPWPFAGRVRHEVGLEDDALTLTLNLTAYDEMPAWLGWHPWFQRRLGRGRRAELDLPARSMFVRGDDGVPTGQLTSAGAGPWDDCFTDFTAPPSVVWPGALALDVDSDCEYTVAYTEPPHAICVEPQTAPPDALRLGLAPTVSRGGALTATMRVRWRLLG